MVNNENDLNVTKTENDGAEQNEVQAVAQEEHSSHHGSHGEHHHHRSHHHHSSGHHSSGHHSSSHHKSGHSSRKKHRRQRRDEKNKPQKLSVKLVAALVVAMFVILAFLVAVTETINHFQIGNNNQEIADLKALVNDQAAQIEALKNGITVKTPIKEWDAPIYDANIPVFELSKEKNEVTAAEKTVAAVYAKYDALMGQYPEYITKTDLGMCSDGVTPVFRYDFCEPEPHVGISGRKEWSETKAKAIIISGIHWEWGGIYALYYALEEIAENPQLFALRRNTHLIVIPVCNPYAVDNQSVRNANKVEIHRNFEVDFIYPGEPGYIEYGERSYGGEEPLSEVETQYIDQIMKDNQDAAFFLTCHSFQQDEVWGTGFIWVSAATKYMCNLGYRVIDKLSYAWMVKHGSSLKNGIAEYRTENLAEGDTRLGFGYLSTTNGTETKQATKYGIQGVNLEICDTFWVHGTKNNPEAGLSSFTMSRGAEVYINFLLTAFGVYDAKDKAVYGG